MTTFDVFINGIQAKRLGESEQIKQELAKFLQMDAEKLEQILNGTSGKRIFRNVSVAEAEQYQKDIRALGAICVYRPTTQSATLSLVDIKAEETPEKLLNCPNCNYEFPAQEEITTPEKCTQCGISIQKFLNIKKLEAENQLQTKAEREEIKQRLLRTENSKNSLEQQERRRQAEEKRIKQLEEEIKKELAIKKDKKPLIYASGVLLITLITGGTYSYFSQPDEINTEQLINDNGIASENAANTPTEEQGIQLTPEQAAEQATKVLDSFGLDPDAMANASLTSNGAPPDSQLSDQAPVPPTTPGSFDLNSPSATNNSASSTTKNPNAKPDDDSKPSPIISSILLNEASNNQLWDHFLDDQVETKIAQNKGLAAYHLSQYLTDTESYIDAQLRLLAIAKQAKNKKDIYSGIEHKISLLPTSEQVQFLAQAGAQQYKTENTLSLLDQARTLEKSLTSPEEQLDAILHLGVAHFKSGNITDANQYFARINDLVSKISSIDQKIHSRISIAKAYEDTGNDAHALQWLLSTKKLMPSASNSAFSEIVTGYAYLDQLEGVLTIIQQRPSHMSQDELLYKAIQAFVSNSSYDSADKLLDHIQEADYKAASYILIASNKQKNEHYLSDTETLINNKVNTALDKAIISSQLALQYSIQPNKQKTASLYQITREYLNTAPVSLEKDEALRIISTNFARTLNTTYARGLLALVQSPIIKSKLEAEILSTQEVKSLIN